MQHPKSPHGLWKSIPPFTYPLRQAASAFPIHNLFLLEKFSVTLGIQVYIYIKKDMQIQHY